LPKILADENTPFSLILLLQSRNIEVVWVPKTEYRGYSDRQLVEIANKGKMIILTHDSDYTELQLRRVIKTGVIHLDLRITDANVNIIADQIKKMLPKSKRKVIAINKDYTSIEKLI